MPADMSTEIPTLQMIAEPSDSVPGADDPAFAPFGYTMSAAPGPDDSLVPSLPSTTAHPSPAAFGGGSAGQPSPASDEAAGGPGADTPPRHESALAEFAKFTKRRNWPAKVVGGLRDMLHILDANGRIKHASPSAELLTGYAPSELRDVFMRDLLHPDDVGVFTAELHESIASGVPLRVFYRLRKKDGSYAVFESVGHAHIAGPKFAPNPPNQTPFCQAVFMMARPYPTRNAALLDSFLEHKVENERLRRKIAELRREAEEEEAEALARARQQMRQGHSDTAMPDARMRLGKTPLPSLADASAPSPEWRASVDAELAGGSPGGAAAAAAAAAAASAAAGARRPSAGAIGADAIEMLTGLRYQEGERSRGISAGNSGPALITGDVGIAIPVDRDSRAGEKKKKLKVAEEYVCTDCGTLDSPEWRKGPNGPKTLCNACGLRWAKREKKKNARAGVAGGSERIPPAPGPAG